MMTVPSVVIYRPTVEKLCSQDIVQQTECFLLDTKRCYKFMDSR